MGSIHRVQTVHDLRIPVRANLKLGKVQSMVPCVHLPPLAHFSYSIRAMDVTGWIYCITHIVLKQSLLTISEHNANLLTVNLRSC